MKIEDFEIAASYIQYLQCGSLVSLSFTHCRELQSDCWVYIVVDEMTKSSGSINVLHGIPHIGSELIHSEYWPKRVSKSMDSTTLYPSTSVLYLSGPLCLSAYNIGVPPQQS